MAILRNLLNVMINVSCLINVRMELKSGNLLGKELNRLKLPGNESKAVNKCNSHFLKKDWR